MQGSNYDFLHRRFYWLYYGLGGVDPFPVPVTEPLPDPVFVPVVPVPLGTISFEADPAPGTFVPFPLPETPEDTLSVLPELLVKVSVIAVSTIAVSLVVALLSALPPLSELQLA